MSQQILDICDPDPWLISTYGDRLFRAISIPDKEFRINLAELQRMYIRKLQCQLAKHVVDMRFHERHTNDWEGDLQKYIQAVRDYDFMKEYSQQSQDPFYLTAERTIDRIIVQRAMGTTATTRLEDTYTFKKRLRDDPFNGPRSVSILNIKVQEFHSRVLIATLGGAFLIGPMWLMVLHNTLYTGLISTTVFVTVFGFFAACYLTKSNEVLSATAAYAAVLVVFVGLNTGS